MLEQFVAQDPTTIEKKEGKGPKNRKKATTIKEENKSRRNTTYNNKRREPEKSSKTLIKPLEYDEIIFNAIYPYQVRNPEELSQKDSKTIQTLKDIQYIDNNFMEKMTNYHTKQINKRMNELCHQGYTIES